MTETIRMAAPYRTRKPRRKQRKVEQLSVRLTPEMIEALNVIAKKHNMVLSEYVRRVLEKEIEYAFGYTA